MQIKTEESRQLFLRPQAGLYHFQEQIQELIILLRKRCEGSVTKKRSTERVGEEKECDRLIERQKVGKRRTAETAERRN